MGHSERQSYSKQSIPTNPSSRVKRRRSFQTVWSMKSITHLRTGQWLIRVEVWEINLQKQNIFFQTCSGTVGVTVPEHLQFRYCRCYWKRIRFVIFYLRGEEVGAVLKVHVALTVEAAPAVFQHVVHAEHVHRLVVLQKTNKNKNITGFHLRLWFPKQADTFRKHAQIHIFAHLPINRMSNWNELNTFILMFNILWREISFTQTS